MFTLGILLLASMRSFKKKYWCFPKPINKNEHTTYYKTFIRTVWILKDNIGILYI